MFTHLPLPEYLKKMAGTPFPSPKGGSALAITGAMGAALVKMCCHVSGKNNPEETRYQEFLQQADALMTEFLQLADEDTDTVYQMIQALRLPKEAPVCCEIIQEGYRGATETLLRIEERIQELIALAAALWPICASSCQIDLYIVQTLAQAAKQAAGYTARANYRALEKAGCPLPDTQTKA